MATRRGGHQQHADPHETMGGSLRRSCTPDPEDPQRNAPVAHGTPHKDAAASATAHATNARQLMVRYKALINDVVVCMGQPINLPMIDDFIALTEDALRGLRTTKVDARSTLRRMQSNPLPMSRRDEPEAPLTPPPQNAADATAQLAAGGGGNDAAARGGAPPPPHLGSAVTEGKSRSYIAAVQGRSVVSPAKSKRTPSAAMKAQELEKRAQELTVDRVVEARDGSALRSEERHRHAEERRKELQDGRQKKIDEASGKGQLAKQRRESAQEKLKSDARERHESATRRAEESKTAVKERAQKSNVRVDEVLFVNEMQQKNKQMKLEMKLSSDVDGASSPEQRREEATRQLKERHEAHAAEVEARQRDLTNQRTERQQQREAHRLESLRRLEEQKRAESEQKHLKIEEREKKVQAQLLSAQAEAEARKARTEERITQSALLREEQREKQKQKLEKSEQKLKEAKERRDREEAAAAAGAQATKPTFAEVMPTLSSAEEDVMTQKLARSVASMQRQSKTFLDQYQKECSLSAKDINKSRLRPLFARVGPSNLTQARQPLHDIATTELADIDHEFVRHSNGFDALVKVLIEARKFHDFATLRVCSDALHRFLTDAIEGPMHTKFFVRAGHLVTLIAGIHEEIKTLRKHNRSITLTSLLSLVSLCVTCVVTDSSSPVSSSASVTIKVAPVRDQIMSDLESVGLDRFCFAIASTCVDEEDMACLQYALLILHHHVLFLSRKRSGDAPTLVAWISQAVTALFTLLQNILTPGGQPLRPQDVLSPLTSCVIFTALRILCTISRWKLDSLQDFLRGGAGKLDSPPQPQPSLTTAAGSSAAGGATRHELFHIVSSFFHYVASHDETLEHLPPTTSDPAALADGSSTLRSFHDALQFGLTLTTMPRVALPMSCTAAAIDANVPGAAPGVAKGGASATVIGGHSFLRASLHELVLLVGYMTLGDTSLQEIFSWGKERPLLALMLSSLPMPYFSQCRHVLFPTLLSILHRDDRNKVIASREMDLDTLEQFLKEECDALPSKLRHQSQVFHEALEADAAAAKTAASLPPPKPVALPKKSWNDLLDEDDDGEEVRIPSPGHPGKPAASVTTAPAERTKAQAEKERLAKAIKSMAPGLAHFRCDRRFPPNMWVDMLVFLSKPLPPPAPEL